MGKTATQETGKSGDKAMAQEICREEVKLRVTNIDKRTDELVVNIENLKGQDVSDFVIRMESTDNAKVEKVKHLLRGYEAGSFKVSSGGIDPDVVKIIPQIILAKPKVSTVNEGWWLCSDQMAKYEF